MMKMLQSFAPLPVPTVGKKKEPRESTGGEAWRISQVHRYGSRLPDRASYLVKCITLQGSCGAANELNSSVRAFLNFSDTRRMPP